MIGFIEDEASFDRQFRNAVDAGGLHEAVARIAIERIKRQLQSDPLAGTILNERPGRVDRHVPVPDSPYAIVYHLRSPTTIVIEGLLERPRPVERIQHGPRLAFPDDSLRQLRRELRTRTDDQVAARAGALQRARARLEATFDGDPSPHDLNKLRFLSRCDELVYDEQARRLRIRELSVEQARRGHPPRR